MLSPPFLEEALEIPAQDAQGTTCWGMCTRILPFVEWTSPISLSSPWLKACTDILFFVIKNLGQDRSVSLERGIWKTGHVILVLVPTYPLLLETWNESFLAHLPRGQKRRGEEGTSCLASPISQKGNNLAGMGHGGRRVAKSPVNSRRRKRKTAELTVRRSSDNLRWCWPRGCTERTSRNGVLNTVLGYLHPFIMMAWETCETSWFLGPYSAFSQASLLPYSSLRTTVSTSSDF